MLKLDGRGDIVWQNGYRQSNAGLAHSIAATSDGGYIVAGRTLLGGWGETDPWLLKLDGAGNVIWQKSFRQSHAGFADSIKPTSDGGYVVAGWTYSSGEGSEDAWVLKFDGQGNLVWQKRYGGTSVDIAYSVIPTSDGGYAVAGGTWSLESAQDAWVLKLDASGDSIWQKNYGRSGSDIARFHCRDGRLRLRCGR